MMNGIIGGSRKVQVLTKALDAQMTRQRVIANNIANVNTPGYQRREVRFEDAMQKALHKNKLQGARTDNKHIALGSRTAADVRHRTIRPADYTSPSGVNNVDIDSEMAKLAENQIGFNYNVKMMQGHYRKLNSAIKGKSIQ